jgi:isopenicillin N synthase-like dioxygenase
MAALPVIDIAGIEAEPRDVAAAIRDAMGLSGFFQIRGHGIDAGVIAGVRQAARRFFATPEDVKQAIAINRINRGYLAQGMARMHGAAHTDLKEVFFWGRELGPDDEEVRAGLPLCGPNQWPALEGFREAVMDYHDAIAGVGDRLLGAVALSLDAPPDFFRPHYRRAMTRGQLIRYPAPAGAVPAEQFGVAPHTDFGCVTLLLQETPGLEVLTMQGEWIAVPPVEGLLVVNIGDLLERWTNRRYPSTRHRVRNISGGDRYSVAMFHDPDPQAIVDPRDLGAEPGQALYPPIAAADYVLERNKGAFAHYGAPTVS